MTSPGPDLAPPPKPAPKPAPKPQPAAAPSVGDFWPGMVRSLKGKVPMGEYSFLSNPAMVQGTLEDDLLVLWTQNDFVKSMIDKPGVVALVNQAAQSLAGGPYRAAVRVGVPSKAAGKGKTPERDPLDDLLAFQGEFQNIISEE